MILGFVGLVVVWLRDANADAATTIENVASLAPEDMVRSILVTCLAKREPITVQGTELPDPMALPAPSTTGRLAGGDSWGEVVRFFAGKQYGFILPDGEAEELWFHAKDVRAADRPKLAQGVRVVFSRTTGKKGPKAIGVRCEM